MKGFFCFFKVPNTFVEIIMKMSEMLIVAVIKHESPQFVIFKPLSYCFEETIGST